LSRGSLGSHSSLPAPSCSTRLLFPACFDVGFTVTRAKNCLFRNFAALPSMSMFIAHAEEYIAVSTNRFHTCLSCPRSQELQCYKVTSFSSSFIYLLVKPIHICSRGLHIAGTTRLKFSTNSRPKNSRL